MSFSLCVLPLFVFGVFFVLHMLKCTRRVHFHVAHCIHSILFACVLVLGMFRFAIARISARATQRVMPRRLAVVRSVIHPLRSATVSVGLLSRCSTAQQPVPIRTLNTTPGGIILEPVVSTPSPNAVEIPAALSKIAATYPVCNQSSTPSPPAVTNCFFR